MKDRRTTPRPDRLFVDSTITGDVEVVTMSTKPGDLGPPITYSAHEPKLDESPVAWPAPRPELCHAEELQREDERPEPSFWREFAAGVAVFAVCLAFATSLFWPLITRNPLA